MATRTALARAPLSHGARFAFPARDAISAALSLAFVGGLFLDGWAHTHKADLETFFTPWHAVLYSGFFAAGGWASWLWFRERRAGYGLAAVGVGLFLVGGVLDGVWHTLFGVESSVEALLSPTHLVLAAGFLLLVSAPLRAAWRRDPAPTTLGALAPALVAASLLLAVLGFFTQILNPFVRPWAMTGNGPRDAIFLTRDATPPVPQAPGGIAAVDVAQMAGFGGFLVATLLLVGLLLVLAGRFGLPFGSATLVLGPYAVLVALMRDQLFVVPVAIAAGLAIDLLAARLRPLTVRRAWLLGAAIPVLVWTPYLAAVAAVGGVWWSVHLWAGVVVVTSAAGFLLALAMRPPGAASTPAT